MLKKIKKHPAIVHHNDVAEICKPLLKLGISYFGHVNINANHEFSAISNNPEFHQHYLSKKYYNVDIHMANTDIVDNCIVWDSVEKRGKSQQLYQESCELGANHTFTIIEKNTLDENYYHFATSIADQSINQTYLPNIDLLRLFIMKFNALVNKSKELSEAYKIKFKIYQNNSDFKFDNVLTDRQGFINDLNYKDQVRLPNGKFISIRQLQILIWLHQGKTINDISKILNIAEITINKQIADLKVKSNCYTQFQLGELFSKLFNHSDEVIKSLVKNTQVP